MTETNRATQRAGAEASRTCEVCQKVFVVRVMGPGRAQRYCSGACRQRARRARVQPTADQVRVDLAARLTALSTVTADALRPFPEAELSMAQRAVSTIERMLADAGWPPADSVTPAAVTPVAVMPVESVTPEPVAETMKSSPTVPPASTFGAIGGLTPTAEQAAIIEACLAGRNLVIEAGAGTGKTSTLRMASSLMKGHGLYVAFNKAIATEAKKSFGSNVACSTAHSLAFRAVGFAYKHRLNGPRLPSSEVADRLGITSSWRAGEVDIPAAQLGRLAMETVARYCRSADAEIGPRHVPAVPGVTGHGADSLAQAIVPHAQDAWRDLSDPKASLMKFGHDHYLKLWALTNPRLDADFILFDEAQDADPLISHVVQSQDAQLIGVGDSCQAIYAWRGAIDALKRWPAEQRLWLTESWRFGQSVADEANKWLGVLKSPLRLTGRGENTVIGGIERPDVILCRTNGEAISRAIAGMAAGRRVALVGGGSQIQRLAEAARDLQQGRKTNHPELFAFKTWEELRTYVKEEEAGADLATMVKLVDDIGVDAIIDACRRLTSERYADLTVSTAHKAKGREWNQVQVARDFKEPKVDPMTGQLGKVAPAEAMLAYVTITRARTHLDRGSLAWIDDHLAGRTSHHGRSIFRTRDEYGYDLYDE